MRPKSIPESLEIDFGRPRGRSMSTSTAFGRCFEECDFLMIFEVCKNQPKNDKSSALGGQNANFTRISRRVGEQGGRPGKGFSHGFTSFGTSFGRTIRHAQHHRLKTGSADLKGSALPADPKMSKISKCILPKTYHFGRFGSKLIVQSFSAHLFTQDSMLQNLFSTFLGKFEFLVGFQAFKP